MNNESNHDDEYVFVQFEPHELQNDADNMIHKHILSNEALPDARQDHEVLDNSSDSDDDFSLSSFDLCDEELELDTEDAEMENVEESSCKGMPMDDNSLHVTPSVASVCTETMLESMKDAAPVSDVTPSLKKSKQKGARPRSVSNANSTASASTATTSNLSRLSNKKRRKKIKQQKKAAAQMAAVEALAAQAVKAKTSANTASKSTTTPASPKSKKKAAANATSIAVLCATQSLAQYRHEMGMMAAASTAGKSGFQPKLIKTDGASAALNIIKSV